MKLKNINPLEKNIDKAVLGLAVLFLLFVAWMYLVADRFPAADSIHDELAQTAQRVQDRQDDPAPAILRNFQVPEYADRFRVAITEPLTPASPIENIGPTLLATPVLSDFGLVLTGDFDLHDGQPRYRQLEVPAPSEIAARSDLVTLDPTQDPRVLEAIGGQPPYDMPVASIAARLDVAQIVEQLQRQPGDLNTNPIPPDWVRETFALLDVEVQRRHRRADGAWSDPVVIEPMPGRASFRGRFDEVSPQNAMQYIETIRAQQAAIIQPAPYLLQNNVWQPPELTDPTAEPTGEGQTPIDPNDPNAQRIRELQLLMRQINNRLGNLETRPPSRARDAEIEQLNQRLLRVRMQLQQLGVGVESLPERRPDVGREMPGDFRDPGFERGGWEEVRRGGAPAGDWDRGMEAERGFRGDDAERMTGSLLDRETVDVWTQDLSVEPGMTYQYRVRLVTSNPLFGRPLPESQEELRDQFTLTGEWSAWTEPVEIHQMRYFWVISGSRDVGYAKVLLWRFHDGIWKETEMNAYPGDPIGMPNMPWQPLADAMPAPDVGAEFPQLRDGLAPVAMTEPIDFSTGYYVVDIDFEHPLLRQVGGIGLARNTIQLIFTEDGDRLLTRVVEEDAERIEPMMTKLLGAGAFETEAERLERLRAERAERLRQQRESVGERDRRPDLGDDDEYIPADDRNEYNPGDGGRTPRY